MAAPRILIVDDDRQFRRTLHLALDSRGYQVDDAVNGEQALETIAARPPDLVVLDWRLPGMDGIETCRSLRAYSTVPVIMASASRANLKEAALNAGANDYLAKPFSLGDLLARIESALKS